jgi:replicative DNA helicase
MSLSIASQFDRLPPHSIEAEMSTLASMMLAGECVMVDEILASTPDEAYFQVDHQIYSKIIRDLRRDGRAIDAVTVREELISRHLLEDVGGNAYLGQIVNSSPSYAHGKHYSAIVVSKWQLREAIAAANDILRDCYAPHESKAAVDVVMAAASRLMLTAATGRADSIIPLSKAIDDLMERLHGGKSLFLPTGLEMLDQEIFGLPLGGYTLIGADSRTGKSLVAKDILLRMARGGGAGGIIAMEETAGKIAANAIANESDVESRNIMGGSMTDADWRKVIATAPATQSRQIYLDNSSATIDQIETSIAIMALKYKCQTVVIDHFHLIDLGDARNETSVQSSISGRLKRAFARHNVAGVVLTQLNKSQTLSERPTERSIRGTNRQFNDADICILLYREDFAREGEPGFSPNYLLEMLVKKNKFGAGSKVTYRIDTAHQRLEEPVPEFQP